MHTRGKPDVLLLAAAILFSSAPQNPVAESFPMSTTVAVAAAQAPETTPLVAPTEGAQAPADGLVDCGADRGRAGRGSVHVDACLAELGAARPAQLARFASGFDVDRGDDLNLATDLGESGSADTTSGWWAGLEQAQRTSLIAAVPGVVGNLEGVPYAERDLANRVSLATTITTLERQEGVPVDGLVTLATDTPRLAMLKNVARSLVPGTAGDDTARSLVSLDTVFPGRAAIAIGDLDTAQDVSYLVPGMLFTVGTTMQGWTDTAATLHSEQQFWTNTLATTSSAPKSVATVAWMGYRTPGILNVAGMSLAREGAVHLEDALTGLRADRAGDEPRLTVIAHSYGSTTSTIAFSSGKVSADSLVLVGSPGSVVPAAKELAVTPGQVFVGAAPLDPVAGSAFFGADPGATQFGATLLNVGSGTDPYTHEHLAMSLSHNDYFLPGTNSLRSMALIGIGRSDLADGTPPAPASPQPVQPNLGLVRPQDIYRD